MVSNVQNKPVSIAVAITVRARARQRYVRPHAGNCDRVPVPARQRHISRVTQTQQTQHDNSTLDHSPKAGDALFRWSDWQTNVGDSTSKQSKWHRHLIGNSANTKNSTDAFLVSEGAMIRLETLIELKFVNSSCSSSNFSIRVFRAYPLVEIRQTVPCRAIRGSSIRVSSALRAS